MDFAVTLNPKPQTLNPKNLGSRLLLRVGSPAVAGPAPPEVWFSMSGLGFRIQGLGFRIYGLGFRNWA